MTNKNLKKALQEIVNTQENSIEKQIALEALEYEEPINFFSDLFRMGCASGMISSLIYYSDTHKFFDTHYHQIQELLEEYEASIGSLPSIKMDLKNTYAWFAFEEVAYQIANDLELEI